MTVRQMKVVSSCAPIPGIINGVDQSRLGREFSFTVTSGNRRGKRPHVANILEIDVVRVSIEQHPLGRKEICVSAVLVKISDDNAFWYPASCFQG